MLYWREYLKESLGCKICLLSRLCWLTFQTIKKTFDSSTLCVDATLNCFVSEKELNMSQESLEYIFFNPLLKFYSKILIMLSSVAVNTPHNLWSIV